MVRFDQTSISTSFRLIPGCLLIQFNPPRRVLSSAVLGGGFCNASFIFNCQVSGPPILKPVSKLESSAKDGCLPEARRHLKELARKLGLEGTGVGMMTGVKIVNNLTILRRAWRDLWVEGFITVGVSNAVRAGDPATYDEGIESVVPTGTINMILLIGARLSDAATVEAIQVATEAKAATLIEAGVKSWISSRPASGTGTDCTAIVSGQGRRLDYAGTHTWLGELIGRVVSDGVLEGIRKCGKLV